MIPNTTGPSSRLIVLTASVAIFPFLVSLLLHNGGVPWGGSFYPRDNLTYELIGQTPLAHFTYHRFTLRPWANVSLHIGWTMVSIGVLYGLFVWCQFGTRERQRKTSTFMAVFVTVVTVMLFAFTACLCLYACVVLKYATDFGFSRFTALMRMKANFNMEDSETLCLRRMRVTSLSQTLSYLNKTQITLKCCGLNGYTDWTRNERDFVPDSCCRIYTPGCGRNFSMDNIYQRGCQGEIKEHIKKQYITQTKDEQIFYLSVSIAFFTSAILITFFSVKTWMKNNNTDNGYVLVSDGNSWAEGSVEKRVTFSDDAQDRFTIEIAINRKP